MPSQASVAIRKTIVKDELREQIPLQEQRNEWETSALTLPLPEGILCEEETIGGVPCLWVRGEQSDPARVILYVHGGGLIMGSPRTHREFAARMVKSIGIPVLLIDYRLAPEHPYPAGLQDVQAVYRTLLMSRFQAQQMMIGGDSSGGGLAFAALIALRDVGVPLPRRAFAISGVFDHALTGESMQTRTALDPFTSQAVLAYCAHLYAPQGNLRDPMISPVYADLSGFPPCLLQVGDHEILLSDSLRLAEKIKQSEGEVCLRVWEAMWHVWPMYPELPEAQGAVEELRDFLL